jgi:glutaredoxin
MSFLFRILGILDDAVNVVVVPTSVWHRMQDERNEALRERDEARAALAEIEDRANVVTVPVLPINAEDERIVEDLIRQHTKEKP